MEFRKCVVPMMLVAALAAGCGNKDGSSGAADTHASKPANPAPPPPVAAPAKPGAAPAGGGDDKVTPKPMPPLESLSFKMTSEKSESGWPKFDAINLSDKTVTFAAIYGYAYDKDGKLVKRLSTPLSWNSKVAPGAKAAFPVAVGSFDKEKVTADVFELCYDSIKFEGDDKGASDSTLCTDKRPKGGTKAAAPAASAAPSAAPAAGKPAPAGKKGKK